MNYLRDPSSGVPDIHANIAKTASNPNPISNLTKCLPRRLIEKKTDIHAPNDNSNFTTTRMGWVREGATRPKGEQLILSVLHSPTCTSTSQFYRSTFGVSQTCRWLEWHYQCHELEIISLMWWIFEVKCEYILTVRQLWNTINAQYIIPFDVFSRILNM